jgi:hypothetical protein
MDIVLYRICWLVLVARPISSGTYASLPGVCCYAVAQRRVTFWGWRKKAEPESGARMEDAGPECGGTKGGMIRLNRRRESHGLLLSRASAARVALDATQTMRCGFYDPGRQRALFIRLSSAAALSHPAVLFSTTVSPAVQAFSSLESYTRARPLLELSSNTHFSSHFRKHDPRSRQSGRALR